MPPPGALRVAQRPALEGRDDRPLGRAGAGPGREAHAGLWALLAPEQVEDRAAQQRGVADVGRELGHRTLAHPPGDRGPDVGDLAREVLGGALDEPGPAQVAPEGPRAERRRQPGVVRAHDPAREQRRRGEHQQLERALDVRGAPRQEPGGEDVQLRLGRPPDEVAPPRRGREPAVQRQPGLRGVELRGGAVQDHRHLPDGRGEQAGEARPRLLELLEDGAGVGGVAPVVAGGEGLRGALVPGQGRAS